jgi:aryl-alcohol dehydrogenase-like predicted oxidoreductase
MLSCMQVDGVQVVLGTQFIAGVFNGLLVLNRTDIELGKVLKSTLMEEVCAIDTSPIYARGFAEEVVGKVVTTKRVWTKIGVDISKALPILDYSVEGMVRSLRESLWRLGTTVCDIAFIHNPSVQALKNIDLGELSEVLLGRDCLCRQLGVSANDPEVVSYLNDSDLPEIGIVLFELSLVNRNIALLDRLSSKYSLALRGIFGQGKLFSEVPLDQIPDLIFDRLITLQRELPIDYFVIGPRTFEQFLSYEQALVSRVRLST